jgi:hypothetical protein
MAWTTLVASLAGAVDEDRLGRNQQPVSHGQGHRRGDGGVRTKRTPPVPHETTRY